MHSWPISPAPCFPSYAPHHHHNDGVLFLAVLVGVREVGRAPMHGMCNNSFCVHDCSRGRRLTPSSIPTGPSRAPLLTCRPWWFLSVRSLPRLHQPRRHGMSGRGTSEYRWRARKHGLAHKGRMTNGVPSTRRGCCFILTNWVKPGQPGGVLCQRQPNADGPGRGHRVPLAATRRHAHAPSASAHTSSPLTPGLATLLTSPPVPAADAPAARCRTSTRWTRNRGSSS